MIKKIIKNKNIIFVTGEQKKETIFFIDFVLKDSFKVSFFKKPPRFYDIFSLIRSDIIVFEDSEEVDVEKVKEFLHLSSSCIFVITQLKNKSRIRNFFNGFKKEWGIVSDFSVNRKLERKKAKSILTFGIDRKKADIYITDISVKEGSTNFKVNNNVNIIPFWIKRELKKKEIYSILPAICIAKMLRINLADISFKFKKSDHFLAF